MSKLFLFRDLDDHFFIHIFGISICFKHKCRFKYKENLEYGITEQKRSPKLIVSLTSYPARIKTVHKTINTLLNQKIKADEIVLWLALEQFPNGEDDLPQELLKLKQLGLTIKWCEDLKSYKKLVPALKEYPDDIIVTADDDVYYEDDVLESLYVAYLNNPNNIYARRAVKLKLDKCEVKGISSRKYQFIHNTKPTFFNQLMGGSGCLYPPHCLYKDCLNIEKIKKLIPSHDDAYFWSMAVLNKTKIQVVKGFDANLHYVEGTQDVGLIHLNKTGRGGTSLEDAYKIMINEYPEILKNLTKEDE